MSARMSEGGDIGRILRTTFSVPCCDCGRAEGSAPTEEMLARDPDG